MITGDKSSWVQQLWKSVSPTTLMLQEWDQKPQAREVVKTVLQNILEYEGEGPHVTGYCRCENQSSPQSILTFNERGPNFTVNSSCWNQFKPNFILKFNNQWPNLTGYSSCENQSTKHWCWMKGTQFHRENPLWKSVLKGYILTFDWGGGLWLPHSTAILTIHPASISIWWQGPYSHRVQLLCKSVLSKYILAFD